MREAIIDFRTHNLPAGRIKGPVAVKALKATAKGGAFTFLQEVEEYTLGRRPLLNLIPGEHVWYDNGRAVDRRLRERTFLINPRIIRNDGPLSFRATTSRWGWVVAGRFTHIPTGIAFTAVNIHPPARPWIGARKREYIAAIEGALNIAEALPGPAILAGDWNVLWNKNRGLLDPLKDVGYKCFQYGPTHGRNSIDYFVVKNGRSLGGRVLPKIAGDHKPVAARIALRRD